MLHARWSKERAKWTKPTVKPNGNIEWIRRSNRENSSTHLSNLFWIFYYNANRERTRENRSFEQCGVCNNSSIAPTTSSDIQLVNEEPIWSRKNEDCLSAERKKKPATTTKSKLCFALLALFTLFSVCVWLLFRLVVTFFVVVKKFS